MSTATVPSAYSFFRVIRTRPLGCCSRKPRQLVKTRFSEHGATLSPDGKYLAYRSSESGQTEVYVQEFPEAKSKYQVSTSGGFDPFWRADGRELYYRTRDRKIMAVPIQQGCFVAGTNGMAPRNDDPSVF